MSEERPLPSDPGEMRPKWKVYALFLIGPSDDKRLKAIFEDWAAADHYAKQFASYMLIEIQEVDLY